MNFFNYHLAVGATSVLEVPGQNQNKSLNIC
jgi:hypothetical protein